MKVTDTHGASGTDSSAVEVDGGAQEQYEVEVWTGPGGSGECMWDPQVAAGADNLVVYDGEELYPDQTYYARVRAYDGTSWGGWSEEAFCCPNIWTDPYEFEVWLFPDQTWQGSLIIGNSGCEPLDFTLSNSESWLTVEPVEGTVAAGGSTAVSVLVNTTGLPPDSFFDVFFDVIVVSSNDPNESPVEEEFKGSIKYWKDENGTLHIPKRRLRDILHRNTFKTA